MTRGKKTGDALTRGNGSERERERERERENV